MTAAECSPRRLTEFDTTGARAACPGTLDHSDVGT